MVVMPRKMYLLVTFYPAGSSAAKAGPCSTGYELFVQREEAEEARNIQRDLDEDRGDGKLVAYVVELDDVATGHWCGVHNPS